MPQQPLPLWHRVIFVDWHGVLSRDLFWTSILGNERHRLHAALQAQLGEIFAQPVCHAWMKGTVSSEQIIARMAVALPSGCDPGFLRRRLDEDCRRMRVNVDLFRLLAAARAHALVLIATDNMDCFSIAFEKARRTGRRPARPRRPLMGDWARDCDAIVCSSDVGALKAQDPHRFFGPFFERHGLAFSQAALIDDRQDNRDAFAAAGGTPVRYVMGTDDIDAVQRQLGPWLRSTAPRRCGSEAVRTLGARRPATPT